MQRQFTLILGGARSGKSSYAQALAAQSTGRVVYIATADAGDVEMAERIANHRAERPAAWETIEAPRNVGAAVEACGSKAETYLLDCLTMLTSNILLSLPEPVSVEAAQAAMDAEVDALLHAVQALPASWLMVSNEVGLGLVPPYPLGRVYRDVLGRVNQRLAQEADEVLFMVAGLPMKVKG